MLHIHVHVFFSYPFGEQLGKTGADKVTGFAFNGEYYDGVTGMVNLRARQYEPAMNRFSQKDMLRGSITHPLSQNRYGFVFNDPMNFVDVDGKAAMLLSTGIYFAWKVAKVFLAAVGANALANVIATNKKAIASAAQAIIPKKVEVPTRSVGETIAAYSANSYSIKDVIAQVNVAKNKPSVNEEIDANCVPSETASTGSNESSSPNPENENNKKPNTSSLLPLLKIAQELANRYNGTLRKKKNANGWIVRITNPFRNRNDMIVRIMGGGSGGRVEPYFRISIGSLGSLDEAAKLVTDRAVTHTTAGENIMYKIIQIIEKYLSGTGR